MLLEKAETHWCNSRGNIWAGLKFLLMTLAKTHVLRVSCLHRQSRGFYINQKLLRQFKCRQKYLLNITTVADWDKNSFSCKKLVNSMKSMKDLLIWLHVIGYMSVCSDITQRKEATPHRCQSTETIINIPYLFNRFVFLFWTETIFQPVRPVKLHNVAEPPHA